MKRILSVLLTIVLLFAMSANAFAAETTDNTDPDTSIGWGLETNSDETAVDGEIVDETTEGDTPADVELPSDEEISTDEETPLDEETPPDEELSTDEQLPEADEICLCDPVIIGDDGIHTNPDCPLYIEVEPQLPIQLMAVSDNNLWSDTGNYNADWSGLTDYDTTTEFAITDAADLAAFIFAINKSSSNTFTGKTVTLLNDIDLSAHLWDMRGGIARGGGNGNFFSGTFDGNGYTISGMTIDYDNAYIGNGSDFFGFGLFSHLFNATVKNLTISDSRFNIGTIGPSSPTGIGSLAGQICGTTVENVSVNNFSITTKPNSEQGVIAVYFGGLAGMEYCGYTRVNNQRSGNTYRNCNVTNFECTYTYSYFGNWRDLFGMGGLVGGLFPSGYNNGAFQSTIEDCTVSSITLSRAADSLTAFGIEAYGGLMGFSNYPVQIINSHVSDFTANITMPEYTDQKSPVFGVDPAVYLGGIIGYADYSSTKTGNYLIENSSADGAFNATGNSGGKFFAGGICGYSPLVVDSCYTAFDLSGLKDKSGVVYGNLFGMLDTVSSTTAVTNNIFNNFDYIATEAEIDEPSVGYLGEKLSTFAACGEINNGEGIDLSQNWGIHKFILTADEKDYPLDYVQCTEKTADMDFYDYWNVDSYSHAFLSQDSDTAQVTFSKDSGDSTFPMSAQVSSKGGNPTWRYTKDIIVLPAPIQYYTVTYLPGTEGAFEPQVYENLLFGDVTPDFDGTPTGNTGWLFDGWEPVVADTVTEDAVYTAQWKPQPTGNLTISKNVTGNAGDTDRDFTFKVDFNNNGTFNYTGSKSGTVKSGDNITLSHGQSVTIHDLPVGTQYTVTELEANKDGYTMSATGDVGTIVEAGNTALFTNYKYVPDPTGSLTISKTVTGNAGDTNKDFTFKVSFSDGGTYSYTGSKIGNINSGDTITLRHNQSITIKDIPVGMSYTVTELEANKNGYTTTAVNASGTIAVGVKTVSIINHKSVETKPDPTGNLIISKTVTGNAGEVNRDFTFKVTFNGGGSYQYFGSKTGTIKSGEAVTLRHGQTVTVLDIPAGTSYTITELEANKNGYSTTVTGGSGVISANGAAKAAFVNHKEKTPDDPTKPSGDLTIKKTVTGNGGSATADFTFRVTFTDNGVYSYIGSKSGTIKSGETVTLRHGQSITILNIPADTRYTVTELEANQNGYKTSVTGENGAIPSNATATAAFVNDKTKVPEIPTDPDVPKTGDDFALWMWIVLLILSGLGLTTAFIVKSRKAHKSK